MFADERERQALNRITHPAIRWEILRQIGRLWWFGGGGVESANGASASAGGDSSASPRWWWWPVPWWRWLLPRPPLLIVLDAPLLVESRLNRWMDVVAVVYWWVSMGGLVGGRMVGGRWSSSRM